MDLKNINTKRKKILFLSIILTFLIVAISMILVLLGSFYNYIYYLIAILFLLIFLFSLAKFLIIPLYEKLDLYIINLISDESFKFFKSKDKHLELEKFYHEDYVKYLKKIKITTSKASYESVYLESKDNKNNINYHPSVFIKVSEPLKDNFAIIKKYREESLRFNEKFQNKFSKIQKNSDYYIYYQDNFDINYLRLLAQDKGFSMVNCNDGYCYYIINVNCKPIEFKLQEKINANLIIDYKKYLNTLTNMIKEIDKLL